MALLCSQKLLFIYSAAPNWFHLQPQREASLQISHHLYPTKRRNFSILLFQHDPPTFTDHDAHWMVWLGWKWWYASPVENMQEILEQRVEDSDVHLHHQNTDLGFGRMVFSGLGHILRLVQSMPWSMGALPEARGGPPPCWVKLFFSFCRPSAEVVLLSRYLGYKLLVCGDERHSRPWPLLLHTDILWWGVDLDKIGFSAKSNKAFLMIQKTEIARTDVRRPACVIFVAAWNFSKQNGVTFGPERFSRTQMVFYKTQSCQRRSITSKIQTSAK